MPAELYQAFYQIAHQQALMAGARRSFVEDTTPAMKVVHSLACNVTQQQLSPEEAFDIFFEKEAVKVLFQKSCNMFWFWSLVRESIEFARGVLPIGLSELEGARQAMAVRMAERGIQLGRRPADMDASEMGIAMALGTVIMLQKRQDDGTYRYLIANPMFADKESQPATGTEAQMEQADTRSAASSAATEEAPKTDKLLNADPDAKVIQKQLAAPTVDEKYDFFLLLEGRSANGEDHPAVEPLSSDAVVELFRSMGTEMNAG